MNRLHTAFNELRSFETQWALGDEQDAAYAARLIGVTTTICTIFILIYSVLWLLIQPRYADRLIYAVIALGIIGLTIILNRLGWVQLSGLVLVAGLWAVVTIVLVGIGGAHAPFFSFYILIVLLAALLFRWQVMVVFTGLSIAAGLIMVVLDALGRLPLPLATPASSWLTQSALLILLTAVEYFVFRRRDQIMQQARVELAERRKVEAALRASEEKFRLISAMTSDYTFSSYFNADGQLEYTLLVGAFEAITGYSAEEFVTRGGWRSTVHPDDVAQDERDMATLNENQRVVTEVRIIKKSGEVRWVRVYGHPIWGAEENRLVGVNGAVQDITERKLAEAALRESENRYRVISEMISDYAYAYDIQPDGSFTPAWITEDSFTRLTGYNWHEIGSKFSLYHPEDVELARQHVEQTVHGEATSGKYRIITKSGAIRWIQIRRHLEWDDQHQRPIRFYGAAADITEQQRAEAVVVRSEQKAQNFQAQLRTLHELSIALEETESLDDFCRMAVELGRSRLGFDRLGLWLYEQNNTVAHGTFGTDEAGRLVDERGIRLPVADYGRASLISGSFGLIDKLASGQQQLVLHDAVPILGEDGTVLGTGWVALEALWDGKRPVGHLSADNLIHQRPLASYQLELLSLYGTTLGHIYSRKLAMQALRESEEKFRTFFELAPYIIVVQQQDGRLLEANPAFLEMVGLTAPEVRGKMLSELGVFDYETIHNTVGGLDEVGRIIHSEQSIRLPDGQLRSMLISSERVQLGGGMNALTVAVDITDRKRAEDALAQERTLLRTVIDHMPENIYVKDRAGKFILNNAESLRILGASRQEEVLGKSDIDYFPPELAESWLVEQQVVMESGKPVLNSELFQPWRQNEHRWVVESMIPLRDEQGEVIGLVGINRDVSESKKTEAALRRSEAFLRALLDATSDVAFLMSPDGTLLTLNRTMAESRGKAVEALIGSSAFGGLPAELREERLRRFEQAAQTAKPVRWEDVNGMDFWDNSIYPVLSPTGSVEAFAIYSRNITEQKHLAAELKRYNTQLEQIVEERTNQLRRTKEQIEIILNNIGDAVALAQPNGDIETSNPAFADMFGETRIKGLERILWTVVDDEQTVTVGAALADVILEQQRRRVETQIVSQNGGDKDIDLIFIPVRLAEEAERPGILVSAHDITHIKEMERFKTRFVADAVHDLATPIAGLSTRLYLLRRSPEKLDDHVRALENQVEHLRNLLADLRMLSQLDRGQLALSLDSYDLNQIVQRVFDTYEPVALSSEQKLKLTVDPSLPRLWLDSRQIERVLVNLFANAVNYTDNGKTIQISTSVDGDDAVISVADQGMGISDEALLHIFERFYRAQEARQSQAAGTGLGLAIVKEIVEVHGGSVAVTSQIGQGSVFTVRLPLKRPVGRFSAD